MAYLLSITIEIDAARLSIPGDGMEGVEMALPAGDLATVAALAANIVLEVDLVLLCLHFGETLRPRDRILRVADFAADQ